ncbi:hypothetical protein Bca101_023625 [Brassica carinata]
MIVRMPQVWNLEGRVEGRDMGPERFQFRFESENDLLTVLAKGPYHHKKWMLILQRWEPVISPNFPSSIAFWIRIHGIPLHYWTDGALHAIGKTLGHVSTRDVKEARIRVELNGLNPLEMSSEIQLPSGEITDVEFEYLKIEKHCFLCFSLLHEEKDCPRRTPNTLPVKDRKLGITQALALERIEAEKRRHDERRGYKPPEIRNYAPKEEKATYQRSSYPYSDNRAPKDYYPKETTSSKRSHSSQVPEEHRNHDHYRPRPRTESNSRPESLVSRSYSQRHRETGGTRRTDWPRSPARPSGSSIQRRHVSPSNLSLTQTHTRDIIANTAANDQTPERMRSSERRSALDRLSEPDLRNQLQRRSSPSRESARLQDVEILFDAPLPQENVQIIGPDKELSPRMEDPGQNSGRTPASQRLGGLSTLGSR